MWEILKVIGRNSLLTFLQLQKVGIGEKPPSITLSHTIIAQPQHLFLSNKQNIIEKRNNYNLQSHFCQLRDVIQTQINEFFGNVLRMWSSCCKWRRGLKVLLNNCKFIGWTRICQSGQCFFLQVLWGKILFKIYACYNRWKDLVASAEF